MAPSSSAFVHFERRVLLDLVQRHRDIVHDRRTDSNSVHRKQQTWLQITDDYNRHPNIARCRQMPQLKRLWQNTRARAKKAGVGRVMVSTKTAPSMLRDSIRSSSAAAEAEVVGANIEPAVHIQQSDSLIGHDGSDGMQNVNEKCLNPGRTRRIKHAIAVTSARMRKFEESIVQQSELHRNQMYREQLAIQSVQADMQRLAEAHVLQLQRDNEVN